MEHLRDQLQKLNLSHCASSHCFLEHALLSCLSDNTPPDRQGIWSSLARLVWTRNGLKFFDPSTLSLTPGMERIDLSYNHLSEADGLESLQRLTHVALSYNRLKSLPPFSSECRIHSLYVSNNHLRNLAGLEALTSLVEVDLSCNLLLHHDDLAPISALPLLQRLDTRGNPFTVDRQHRSNVMPWLHKDISTDGFVLDGQVLTKREGRNVLILILFNPRLMRSCL